MKLNFTCINKRPGRLIWTHSIIQSYAYPRKAKGGEEEGRKEGRDLLFGLWSFALGHSISLVLERILYYLVLGLVIYLEEVFFDGFSIPRGFPRIYCCCLCDCVSISDACAYYFREYCKDTLNLSKHT